MTTNGMPTNPAPATSRSPRTSTWASYQTLGTLGGRWGSLQRIGRPVAERRPSTTQLLLAIGDPPDGSQRAASASAPRSASTASAGTAWNAKEGPESGVDAAPFAAAPAPAAAGRARDQAPAVGSGMPTVSARIVGF